MEQELRPFSSIIIDALRAKNLNVEKLVQLTGVSDRFIALLLDEQFERLPAAPYTRGYILKIAEVLGLDGERLWREYLKNHDDLRKSGSKDTLPPNRFETPTFLSKKIIAGAVLAILVIVFFLLRLPSLFGTPELSITNIPDNLVVSTSTYAVTGKVNPQNQLTVQGQIVYPQGDGSFSRSVSLQPGFNTIEFKVKKLLEKEIVITKQIFYQTSSTHNGTP